MKFLGFLIAGASLVVAEESVDPDMRNRAQLLKKALSDENQSYLVKLRSSHSTESMEALELEFKSLISAKGSFMSSAQHKKTFKALGMMHFDGLEKGAFCLILT